MFWMTIARIAYHLSIDCPNCGLYLSLRAGFENEISQITMLKILLLLLDCAVRAQSSHQFPSAFADPRSWSTHYKPKLCHMQAFVQHAAKTSGRRCIHTCILTGCVTLFLILHTPLIKCTIYTIPMCHLQKEFVFMRGVFRKWAIFTSLTGKWICKGPLMCHQYYSILDKFWLTHPITHGFIQLRIWYTVYTIIS